MSEDRFPTGRFGERVKELQAKLNVEGFGPVQEDGWFGGVTAAALEAREKVLAELPPPPKPWWKTRRAKGLLAALMGGGGFLSAFLGNIDTAFLVELAWSGLDYAERAVALVSAIVALVGTITGIIGAYKAEAQIDTGLIARVRGKDIRIGGS
jgi:hypothetical protein